MSTSAGTPSASAMKVAGSDRACLAEPSPASTYGGSVSSDGGGEAPPTPNDGGLVLKKLANLTINVEKAAGGVKAGVERYSPPFVRNGSQGRVEDPFVSPHPRGSSQRTPTGPKFLDRAGKSDNWRSGSSSGGSASVTSSPTADKLSRTTDHKGGVVVVGEFGPDDVRTSKGAIAIKAEDAQAHYPPSSCVFVANLLQSESDEALEVAVTQAFREYGIVFVKIRRDAKHMPFAFCQFTNDRDATRAIKEARGRLIKGRPCRCEKAKAHRLFFFERKYGEMITVTQVQDLLHIFGKISYCRKPTKVEQVSHNLGDGVIVQFELYDEGQAALQAYRNHDEFKMQSLADMTMVSPARGRISEDPAGRNYLIEYDIERRSIYVGNLPLDAIIDDLRDLFEAQGSIIKVTLHKNESIVEPNQQRCFAFVEFASQPAVTAVLSVNLSIGYTLRDSVLRVAQKDTEAAMARSLRRRSVNGLAATGRVAPFQSPAIHGQQQQVSAFVGVHPQVYGSAFSSPVAYSPMSPYFNYGAYGSPMYTAPAGQAYYGTHHYPAAYYPNSPTYNFGGSAASSPINQQFYYPNQQGYGYSPTFAPGAYQTYAQSAVNTGAPAQDDRSSTPTPAGRDTDYESFDSQ